MVADQRRHLRDPLNRHRAAIDSGGLFGYLFDAPYQLVPGIRVVGAQSALQHRLVRNDVGGRSGTELADGQHAGMGGVGFPSDQLLQCQMNVNADVDWIHGGVGVSTVAALTVDGDTEAVYGEHGGAGAVVHYHAHRHFPGRDVEGDGSVHTLQDAVGNHIPAALKGLLGGLEHETDGAFQRTFLLLEHFRGGQQHGGMEVVAAGVGLCAGGAGEGLPTELRHGQGVHIRPQQQGFSAGADLGGDAVSALLGPQPGFRQFLHHIVNGFWHFQPNFGVLMEIAAVGDGFFFQLQGKFIIIHAKYLLFSWALL